MEKRYIVSSDVEGPIINPKFDFAWVMIEDLAEKSKMKDLSVRVKAFDQYDDNMWLHERSVKGHSTGATPIISSLLAITYGESNERLLQLAAEHSVLTPGATQLLRWLKNTKRIEPYFISGAHPALVVPAAYKLGISSCHVFCNGHQLTEKEAEIFDKKRREKPDENHQTILNEVRERFPYEKYANSQTLRQFLDRYLEICIKINDLYIQNQISESRLQSMKKEQLGLLREVRKIDSDLAKDLKYLLYTEDGVMGAHRKKQALALIEKREKAKKECLIYIGDGMVDADPLAYAGNGISVNCTNKDALLSSRLNVATPNLEALIPVIDLIVTDKHTLPESKDYLEKEINKRISSITNTAPESVLFTADEIKADINAVTQANKLCKDYIKKLQ